MPPELTLRDPLDYEQVMERVEGLRTLNTPRINTRQKIRAIMRGGPEAVDALLGSNRKKKHTNDEYLQAVNLMASASSKLGIDLGQVPDVKTSTTPTKDGSRHRYKATEIEQIVMGYDERNRLDIKLPWLGRWLPGYGYGFMFVGPQHDPLTGHWYPRVNLRNSYDVWPGWFGPDSRPREAACVRPVDISHLAREYPMAADAVREARRVRRSGSLGALTGAWFPGERSTYGSRGGSSWWEGNPNDAVTVIEYFDVSGRYVIIPELEKVTKPANGLVEIIPNPLPIPFFTVPVRPDFDESAGEWDHTIGIQMMLAKLTILSYIAAEDGVFSPTAIIGDPMRTTVEYGRRKVVHLPSGANMARVPVDANLVQTWQQIGQLERQARISMTYPVSEDGQSPNSFATGRAIEELRGGVGRHVSEYQTVLGRALEDVDMMCLAWDYVMYAGKKKPYEANVMGERLTAEYDPKTIGGRFVTSRKYGVMATWDDPTKIVAGLQLLSAGVIDLQTMRENLQGLDGLANVEERVTRERLTAQLEQVVGAIAIDPQHPGRDEARAIMAQMLEKPLDTVTIIQKWLNPDPATGQLSPEEAVIQQQAQMQGAFPEENPSVSSILSRLELTGAAEGGVQTVATG